MSRQGGGGGQGRREAGGKRKGRFFEIFQKIESVFEIFQNVPRTTTPEQQRVPSGTDRRRKNQAKFSYSFGTQIGAGNTQIQI